MGIDKCSKGAYKSRITCADVKARYSAAEEEGLDVFVPTPTPEANNLLEVYALMNDFFTRSLDIVAAFLIWQDRGAAEGKHVYMRPPVEWYEVFLSWLETFPASERSWYRTPSRISSSDWTETCTEGEQRDRSTAMS